MNDTAQDMRKWQLIDKTVRNEGSTMYEETTNTYLAPARLKTCTTRHGTRYQIATISWPTSDEKFNVNAGEISCEDGEQIVNVKITTITSRSRGCTNGHARLIAVETEPGVWQDNALPS
ncbi:hypothetical protein EYC58_03950 [Candidatus Saccharibacteria bacterium]|nr:MAG: hypothetical protein EYC58_03950 [Candidatus Saccharibacteria bacterium]